MKQSRSAERGSNISPTDSGFLVRPLDFISENHLRGRQICAAIDGLATGASFDRQAGTSILRFLTEDLNLHQRDKVEDLFPLLVQRCKAEDTIESAISRITADQNEARCLLPEVCATLAHCLNTGYGLSGEERAMLIRFIGHVRRHLAAENAILLPIARARLTRADLKMLSEKMRSRRGLQPHLDTRNAQ